MHQDTARFRKFVLDATGADKDSQIADTAGIVRSTFYSALKKDLPISAEMVIQVCVGYGLSVLDGLRAAGYITDTEVQQGAQAAALESAPDSKLLGHLLHRATLREQQEDDGDDLPGNDPTPDDGNGNGGHADDPDDNNVIPLHPADNEPMAASKRKNHTMDHVDPDTT